MGRRRHTLDDRQREGRRTSARRHPTDLARGLSRPPKEDSTDGPDDVLVTGERGSQSVLLVTMISRESIQHVISSPSLNAS